MENTEDNSEKIGKIIIVKWFGKYGRKASRIVIRYGQYRRKVSQIVKRYGKYEGKASWIVKRDENYGRNDEQWKDLGNADENSKKIGKILKKSKLNNEKYGRNQSWIVKKIGKYRRKLWKNMKNIEEK